MNKLLEELEKDSSKSKETSSQPHIGIGLDSAVIPIKGTDCFLIQSCDYFYPIVDDPFMMGKITCANVLSDVYAMGVTNIDSLQIIVKNSSQMTENEIKVIVPLLHKGFMSAASEAGCKVNFFNIIENPWCTIGGIASSVCLSDEFIMPENAEPGNVLVLTKPLGTQIACSAHHWIDIPEKWEKIKNIIKEEDLIVLLKQAMSSMARLNKVAASLMHKYNVKCCTDVTGFGILGHANNLVKFQKNKNLKFVIEKLPVFQNADKVAEACNMSKLGKGISPETSGGLLLCMTNEDALSFCNEIEEIEKHKAWIIGHVVEGNAVAELAEKVEIISVG